MVFARISHLGATTLYTSVRVCVLVCACVGPTWSFMCIAHVFSPLFHFTHHIYIISIYAFIDIKSCFFFKYLLSFLFKYNHIFIIFLVTAAACRINSRMNTAQCATFIFVVDLVDSILMFIVLPRNDQQQTEIKK